MAEQDGVATTATAPRQAPVINGATRSGATPVPTITPVAPQWPHGVDPERPRADWAVTVGAWDPATFPTARHVLADALVVHAWGGRLDPDEQAQRVLDPDDAPSTGLSLRALAAQARARGRVDDPAGRALTAAGIDEVAGDLDVVADRLATAGGFVLPDLVIARAAPHAATERAATAQQGVSPVAAAAGEFFDRFSADRLRFGLAGAQRSVLATSPPEDFPLREQDVRDKDTLRQWVRTRLNEPDPELLDAEPASVDALYVVNSCLESVSVGTEMTAQSLARHAGNPVQTARLVGQVAAQIDGLFPTREAQLVALGAYGRGRCLSDHLQAISLQAGWLAVEPATAYDRMLEMVDAPAGPVAHSDGAPAEGVTLSGGRHQPTAAPAPDQAAGPAPARDPQATMPNLRPVSPPDTPAPADLYTRLPDLLQEHAFLGSLLCAPHALDALEHTLSPQAFSQHETRVLYNTLRGLYHDRALFDVASMPTQPQQLDAARENQRRLFVALNAQQGSADAVPDIPRLIGQISAAAPPESVPYRGVYNPRSQHELGLKVFENHVFRQLRAMGAQMRATTPLVASHRGERQAGTVVSNLEQIQGKLQELTGQWIAAVSRTDTAAAARGAVEAEVTRAASGRWKVPDALRVISAPRLHRAEAHVLQLAMNAGTDAVPAEIATLSPEDFTSPRHANTWRVIQQLQQMGQQVTVMSVHGLAHSIGFEDRPVLSDRQFLRMNRVRPADLAPEKVAQSLRTVVTSSLTRAQTGSAGLLAELADTRDLPADRALEQAAREVTRLGTQATTAHRRHQAATATATRARVGGR